MARRSPCGKGRSCTFRHGSSTRPRLSTIPSSSISSVLFARTGWTTPIHTFIGNNPTDCGVRTSDCRVEDPKVPDKQGAVRSRENRRRVDNGEIARWKRQAASESEKKEEIQRDDRADAHVNGAQPRSDGGSQGEQRKREVQVILVHRDPEHEIRVHDQG